MLKIKRLLIQSEGTRIDWNNPEDEKLKKKFWREIKLHILNYILNWGLEFIILGSPTIFGWWNLSLGLLSLTGWVIYSTGRGKTYIYKVSQGQFMADILLLSELSILPFLHMIAFGDNPLFVLIPFPMLCKHIILENYKLWVKIFLMGISLIFQTYRVLITPPDAIIILVVVYIYIVLIQHIIKSEETWRAKEKEEKRAQNVTEGNILNQIPTSILIYHLNTGIIHINSTFTDLIKDLKCLDYNDFAEKCICSKSGQSLLQSMDDKIHYFRSQEAILHKINQLTLDFEFQRSTSRIIKKEMEIKFCRMRGNTKKSIFLIINESDKEALQREEKIKTRYKNVISKSICHDLKTPLNGIITPLENLPDLLVGGELPVQMIKMSAKLLEYKIEDMIDYSKIELNEFKPDNKIFDVKTLLITLKNLCKRQAEFQNLKIKINFDRTAPEKFCGDQKRITQIMLHLIQNAIKYSNSGLIIIYVKRSSLTLEFGVIDQGIGMKPKIQEYLHQFLEKGISTLSIATKDLDLDEEVLEMGFGLLITERICKNIGGRLDFSSSENNGSKFYFEISQMRRSSSYLRLHSKAVIENIKKRRKKDQKRRTTVESKLENPKRRVSIKKMPLVDINEDSEDKLMRIEEENISMNSVPDEDNFQYMDEVSRPRHNTQIVAVSPPNMPKNIFLYPVLDEMPKDAEEQKLVMKKGKSEEVENIRNNENEDILLREGLEYSSRNLFPYSSLKPKRIIFGFPSSPQIPVSSRGVLSDRTHRKVGPECSLPLIPIPRPFRNKTALVVDDGAVNRLVLKMLLQGYGMGVEEASNGQIAVDMCTQKIDKSNKISPYSVIFMDIDMPVMNGLEATKALIERFKGYIWGCRVPIIAVTAYDTSQIKDMALKVGMNEFVVKPIKNKLIKLYLDKYLK